MKNQFIPAIKSAAIATALLFAAAIPTHAITITVTNTNDNGPGSLRASLAAGNDGDTIDATGVSGTILLTSGELQITHNVTINGPGTANLAVNGNATSRVFDNFASNVTISGLTITNGLGSNLPNAGGGGVFNQGGLTLSNCTVSNNVAGSGCCYSGGGIFNNGSGATLTVTDSTISGNSASFDGGGIENTGTLTVTNSSINGSNSAARDGGGIDSNGGLSMTISGSTISDNSAGNGGGMCACGYTGPTTTVTNSTISGNSAGTGGGIWNVAQHPSGLTVLNSTISGNSATGNPGGGISNSGDATVTNSTISGNSAINGNSGGGISNGSYSLTLKDNTFSGNSATSGGAIFNWLGGTTQIDDTVLNAGPSGGTLFDNNGTITSLGYNLASDNGGGFLTGSGDQINTDPLLGPLQDNGGPTFTHELLPSSPAIDAGDPSFAPPPDFDQRGPGYARVVNGRIDIGSFEVQPTVRVTVQTNPAGLTFSVDGTTYGSTQRFTWTSGSSHTIATTSPQSGGTGVQYVWSKWSDHGAISHTVAPTINTTYTATFRTQYFLTMIAGTGGRVSPTSGWKNSGATVSISARPARNYSFTNWTGTGTGSYSGTNNPASITMGGPITETATFTHN